MRTSLVFFLLLLWFHILHGAQGIRLDKGFLPIKNKQIQEEKKTTTIKTGAVNVAAGAEVVVLCKGGHCSTGRNRKPSTTTVTTNTYSKDGGNEANSLKHTLKGKSGNHEEVDENLKANISPDHQQHYHYVDMTDISEMDYSPARRKTPIHN